MSEDLQSLAVTAFQELHDVFEKAFTHAFATVIKPTIADTARVNEFLNLYAEKRDMGLQELFTKYLPTLQKLVASQESAAPEAEPPTEKEAPKAKRGRKKKEVQPSVDASGESLAQPSNANEEPLPNAIPASSS